MHEHVATALAVTMAADVLFDIVPNRWLEEERRRMRLPEWTRPVIPAVKVASASGLFLGLRRPALGRITSNALIGYFLLAIGAHVRVRDHPVRVVPAAAMLAWTIVARTVFAPAEIDG